MGITIKEIAMICGVSPGTVDRALNDRPGISAKTKSKVLEIAKELNYQPDHMARSLAKGRTLTLGVVLFDLYNRSFSQLMNAIEKRSRELGYFVHLVLTDKDQETEKKCIEHLIHRKVDGIILFSVNMGEEFDYYLQRINIPIVTICNRVSDHWPYIGIDDYRAMKEAVNFVINKGYRRFIYVCPPLSYLGKSNIYTQEERLKGFQDGLREHGISEEPVIIKEQNYIASLNELTFFRNGKEAILCSCDIYALEVINYLKSREIKIPEEIGVIGFDNIDVLKYVTPKLTTVEYVIEDIGIKAVECLVGQIENGEIPAIPLLDYRLIVGQSI